MRTQYISKIIPLRKLLNCQKFLRNGMKNLGWWMGHKEDFFEFTYLQKVKNIIDEASVNEYVKNKEVTKI